MTCGIHAFGPPEGMRESQSFFPGDPHKEKLLIISFGDSIASGFNSSSWFKRVEGGTYADHLGRKLQKSTNRSVEVKNQARAGYRISKIYKLIEKSIEDLRRANFILLEGGGIDFLMDSDFCNLESYTQQLNYVEEQTQKALQYAAKEKIKSARVGLIGIYLPNLNELKKKRCRGEDERFRFIRNMDRLAELNWRNRQIALRFKASFADVFSALNCLPQGKSLCEVKHSGSLDDYRRNILRAYAKGFVVDLDAQNYAQKDRLHPNFLGNAAIAALFN